MLIKHKFLLSGIVFSALLSSCATWTQPAAPVEQASYGGGTAVDHPYGAPAQNNAPYVPADPSPYAPAQSQSTYVAPQSPYPPSNTPVDLNAATHTVIYGDTVYNISKRYRISENDLRTWNNLPDNNIRIGQILTVRGTPTTSHAGVSHQEETPLHPIASGAPVATTTQQIAPAPTGDRPYTVTTTVLSQRTVPVGTVPPGGSLPPSADPVTPTPAATPAAGGTRTAGGIVWMRPTRGRQLSDYGQNGKGIDYGGNIGDPVYAAADGRVVYAGNNLSGYGNLVIIQHNPTYLTAYANNQSLLVQEQQQVRRGQEIARMGNSGATRVQMHFELRENGKPVNPAKFIP